MQYAVFTYRGTGNLGDAIQTVALSRLLPGELAGLDRGSGVASVRNAVWVLNGWLGNNQVPAAPCACLFAGIFLAHEHNLPWLRASAFPVGARDPGTAQTLATHGIRNETIGCASLTFERYRGPRLGSY